MSIIDFYVPGNPQALKRHRHYKVGNFVKTYDPSQNDKMDFIAKCINNRPTRPITGPITLVLHFKFLRPKSHFGTGKNASIIKNTAPAEHITKPDLDNLVKFIKDALNKVFWKDDSQITTIIAAKKYSENAGVSINIKYDL